VAVAGMSYALGGFTAQLATCGTASMTGCLTLIADSSLVRRVDMW
jgi:hypothetical protein